MWLLVNGATVQTNHSAGDEGTDQTDLSILLGDAATDCSTTTTIKGCREKVYIEMMAIPLFEPINSSLVV